MNRLPKIIAAGALAAAIGFAVVTPAEAADPVPVITCASTTVAVGETLSCTVTGTAGLTPSVRITYTNPSSHKTNNVWNGQYQTFNVTYRPDAGEVGRTEVLIATVSIPTYPGSRLVRQSSGYAYFAVTAPAPVEPPVAPTTPSTLTA